MAVLGAITEGCVVGINVMPSFSHTELKHQTATNGDYCVLNIETSKTNGAVATEIHIIHPNATVGQTISITIKGIYVYQGAFCNPPEIPSKDCQSNFNSYIDRNHVYSIGFTNSFGAYLRNIRSINISYLFQTNRISQIKLYPYVGSNSYISKAYILEADLYQVGGGQWINSTFAKYHFTWICQAGNSSTSFHTYKRQTDVIFTQDLKYYQTNVNSCIFDVSIDSVFVGTYVYPTITIKTTSGSSPFLQGVWYIADSYRNNIDYYQKSTGADTFATNIPYDTVAYTA